MTDNQIDILYARARTSIDILFPTPWYIRLHRALKRLLGHPQPTVGNLADINIDALHSRALAALADRMEHLRA